MEVVPLSLCLLPSPSFSTPSVYLGCPENLLSIGLVGVSTWGRGHRADLGEQKLLIEWEVYCEPQFEEGSGQPQGDTGSTSWDPLDYAAGARAVDVYLTDPAGKVLSYDPTKLMDYNHFATEHDIHASGHFPIPFDSYNFQVYAFAINPATNQSVNVVRFSVPDSPRGFTLSSSETEVAKLFTCATEEGPKTVEIKSRMLTIAVRYSTFTLTLTTCMFVVNWTLALASLYTAFSAVTKGSVTWPVFIRHSAMVLVVLSIRKLYLCPPPVGMFLDTVGFFSQIVILSFSSVALLQALLVLPAAHSPPTTQKA